MIFKKTRHLTFVFLPIVVAVAIAIGIFVMESKVPEVAATIDDNLAGHTWDTYYGWNSYNNCNNDYYTYLGLFPPPPPNPCYPAQWGLDASFTTGAGGEITGGSIEGFMWHDALGWICVGNTCTSYTGVNECGADTTPPVGNLAVTFDATTRHATLTEWWGLKGWGKICSWSDTGEAAWISFSCENDTPCVASDYEVYINVDDFTLGNPDNGLGDCGSGTLDGGPIVECGFAWNGYTANGGDYGAGFIMFNPAMSVIHVVHFETEEGDVYAYRDIDPNVDSGADDATYLILTETGTIANFTSEERYKYITESYSHEDPDLFIDPARVLSEVTPGVKLYSNALSFLDVQGMIDGNYGTVNAIGTPRGAFSDTLDGELYYRAGDLVINGTQTFDVANGTNSGAGTFIIDGNLTIESNIQYEQTPLGNIVNLPSAVFIVLGDVIIDQSVTRIDGNFIVLGDGNPASCPSLTLAGDGCGRFNTGVSTDDALTINGMIMSKQFNFQRMYTDILNTASELILYDGRLVTNTPPGLEEITETLPIFKETSPF